MDSSAASRTVLIAYRDQLRHEIREIEKELEVDHPELAGAPTMVPGKRVPTSQ